APDGLGHRVLGDRLDRGRRTSAVARRWRRGLAGLAEPALPAADLRRSAGFGDRTRVRLQPGAARDEGRDHGLLVPDQHLRQPLGAADQRRRPQRRGDLGHRLHRAQRERVPDVLLRPVRIPGGAGVRGLCAQVSDAGQLPRVRGSGDVSGGGVVPLVRLALTVLVSWQAFGNRRLLERLLLWPPAIERERQFDRLVTHGFVHADWQHLLFNMVTLFFFGRYVEQIFAPYIGSLGFALFYLSAIVVAILPTYLRHRHDAGYRSLGASGAVSSVLFAFILVQPWALIFVFFIPVPAIVYGVLYVGYSIWMERRGGDNVNHSAHLWGAGYGLLFTVIMEPGVVEVFLARLMSPMS